MLKITKLTLIFILLSMNRIFYRFFDCVKRKKGYFILLLMLSIVAIVLGVVAAINFGGGVFSIDLSNIAYIRFLKSESGFMSMVFGLVLSLFMFYVACLICHWKSWLVPLGVVFYLYLVYSQSIVFMSIILIYGFFNCIILSLLLMVYTILIWGLFLVFLCEILCLTNSYDYFRCSCSLTKSNAIWILISLIVLTFIFGIILLILKNYVVLLIF